MPEAAQLQILPHSEEWKHLAPLRYQSNPEVHALVGRQLRDVNTAQADRPGAWQQHARGRAQSCGFAGAVGAEQGHDLALLNLESQIATHHRLAISKLKP